MKRLLMFILIVGALISGCSHHTAIKAGVTDEQLASDQLECQRSDNPGALDQILDVFNYKHVQWVDRCMQMKGYTVVGGKRLASAHEADAVLTPMRLSPKTDARAH